MSMARNRLPRPFRPKHHSLQKNIIPVFTSFAIIDSHLIIPQIVLAELVPQWFPLSGDNPPLRNCPMIWYLKVLTSYATFNGRAGRKEFWIFILLTLLIAGMVGYLDVLLGLKTTLLSIYSISICSPTLAVSVRRLHDTGKSGWWILISLVPVAGLILFFFWAMQKSRDSVNRYGHPPQVIEARELRSVASS